MIIGGQWAANPLINLLQVNLTPFFNYIKHGYLDFSRVLKGKTGETMEEIITGIYTIKNIVNNKIYVGKSININRRWFYYKNTKYCHNEHLKRSLEKYGVDSFLFEICEICGKESLDERECFWISYYESWKPERGYNKTFGGEGCKPTPEALINMSRASIGRIPNEETRKLMSENASNSFWVNDGINERFIKKGSSIPENMKLGRLPRTEESKRKTSESCKIVLNTPEVKERMTNAIVEAARNRDCSHSEETKERISIARKKYFENEDNREKQKEFSKYVNREQLGTKVVCVNTNERFICLGDAAEKMYGDRKYKARVSRSIKDGVEVFGYSWLKIDETSEDQEVAEAASE
jgi:group I intron endonuclease